ESVFARGGAARDLEVDGGLAERAGGDGVQHPAAQAFQVQAADADRFQAVRQPAEVLVRQPRPPLVDAQHLVHRVAEEEAAVERGDLGLRQGHQFAVEVREGRGLIHELLGVGVAAPASRVSWRDDGTGGAGRRRVNLVPRPTSLSTAMAPPWASMILRVVASPSPLPPCLVEKNGWNTRARTSGVIPRPVSIRLRQTVGGGRWLFAGGERRLCGPPATGDGP